MTTPLQRHGDDFVARNLLVSLCLGLERQGQRLDDLLARRCPEEHPPPPALDPDDEAVAHFVLGLVAFRRALRAHLDARAPAEVPAPEPARAPSWPQDPLR